MIKFLIFDMDGTLIELKDVHYEAFNRALASVDEKYVISREEHTNIYDGLPTKVKLAMLTQHKGLPIDKYDKVWNLKQELTSNVINDTLLPDERVNETLSKFRKEGYRIAVASNSIGKTIKAALRKTNIIEYIDFYMSNEEVTNAKPHPEMFLTCMKLQGFAANETMIFEDSKYGIEAAKDSGAYVYEVKSSEDIVYDDIKFRLDYIEASKGFYR